MPDFEQRTPFQIYESILQTLSTSPARIDLIQRDQKLISEGWTIHFAVDPHDIHDFCFPFRNYSLREIKPNRVEEMSRIQNGRYEAMFNLTTRPILLAEYEIELDSILNWALRSNSVQNDDETIDRYLQTVHLNTSDELNETRETLTDLTERDISSTIAIVTGIGAIGSKRLSEIVNRRLVRNIPGIERGREGLKPRKYVVATIEDRFARYFEQSSLSPNQLDIKESLLKYSRINIKRNNRRDAFAFDQLLQLNKICNKQKHLLLYFSSAPKSLELDGAKELRDVLPVIDGKPYQIVRTAADLFVYMIYKGKDGEQQEPADAVTERLSDLANLLTEVESIRDGFKAVSEDCEQCTRNDRDAAPCKFASLCDGVRKTGEYIEERQYLNVNLSLEKRLAQALETTHDQSPQSRYREILGMLSQILADKKLRRPKDQEMEMVLRTSLNKANFVSALMNPKKRGEYKGISCHLNYYPVCLRLVNPNLSKIVGDVVDILGNWSDDRFEEVVGAYLELDAEWVEDPESELVRCFLYLVMDRFGRASDIADSFLHHDPPVDEGIIREFVYLLGFIIWRERSFNRAIELVTKAIEDYPGDGRFPHLRSMITQSLLESDPQDTSQSFLDVLADTEDAIKAFSTVPGDWMVAVCHNNAAFYLSDPGINLVNVALAEEHLQELIRRIPENTWNPLFPEFFHTKGSVFYSKFIADVEKREFLDEAYKAAKRASELHPTKDQHKALLHTIVNAYRVSKLELPKD